MSEQQLYCISARNRRTGYTEDITGSMSNQNAIAWRESKWDKKSHVYFRVAKFPFKRHKKGGIV